MRIIRIQGTLSFFLYVIEALMRNLLQNWAITDLFTNRTIRPVDLLRQILAYQVSFFLMTAISRPARALDEDILSNLYVVGPHNALVSICQYEHFRFPALRLFFVEFGKRHDHQ